MIHDDLEDYVSEHMACGKSFAGILLGHHPHPVLPTHIGTQHIDSVKVIRKTH